MGATATARLGQPPEPLQLTGLRGIPGDVW